MGDAFLVCVQSRDKASIQYTNHRFWSDILAKNCEFHRHMRMFSTHLVTYQRTIGTKPQKKESHEDTSGYIYICSQQTLTKDGIQVIKRP